VLTDPAQAGAEERMASPIARTTTLNDAIFDPPLPQDACIFIWMSASPAKFAKRRTEHNHPVTLANRGADPSDAVLFQIPVQ